ncbi:MAG TPA: hypothetical protein VJ183_04050 [Chloroflexia bacterium]|nr:hypothetical protein [Chloroflexia bacterium]
METTVTITAKQRAEDGRRVDGWQRAFAIAICVVAAFMVAAPVVFPPGVDNAHYTYLAQNLVQGRLSVDNIPAYYPDLVTWQGHTYLPLGPLPGVLLIPFLPLLMLGVQLVWVGYLFTLLNVWLFYRVLGQAGVTGERRQWALLLFFGSTSYLAIAVIGSSYFFAHITTLTFILAAVTEALGKRRPLLIGLFIGLAGMVRLTAIFSLPFFLWLLWRTKDQPAEDAEGERSSDESSIQALGDQSKPKVEALRVRHFAVGVTALLLGLVGPIVLLGLYNYLRFGSFLESGYSLATLGYPPLRDARSYGLFSLAHIPKNLVMMLFQGPLPYPRQDAPILLFPYMVPSPWGMGLLYTSPALLYAFRNRLKDTLTQACLLGALCGMVPIITYYGVGWIQFGFRYALDFLPFVLILAARGFPNPMSRLSRILVLAGTAVCIWGSTFLLIWIHEIKLGP